MNQEEKENTQVHIAKGTVLPLEEPQVSCVVLPGTCFPALPKQVSFCLADIRLWDNGRGGEVWLLASTSRSKYKSWVRRKEIPPKDSSAPSLLWSVLNPWSQ